MKSELFFDKDFRKLYNSAVDIVNMCWDNGKGWIGTETIRKSGKFLELAAKLSDSLIPFEDRYNELGYMENNWQDFLLEPDDEFMEISDANAESLKLEFENV